jgi:alpha-L-rhamnosidase
MIELASALGKTADAAMYTATRATLASDFHPAWYLGGGVYGDAGKAGLQTSNAAALFLNVPTPGSSKAATEATLVQDVATTHDSHWSTGIIGMRYLHASLTAAGNGSLAVNTLLQTTYPSFGYWFSGVDETPATTMWELPDAPSQG